MLTLCLGEDTFYVLRFSRQAHLFLLYIHLANAWSREAYVDAVNAGQVEDDGVEVAFEIVTDINESVRTGQCRFCTIREQRSKTNYR